jgi:large subunit ribosomal protein L5
MADKPVKKAASKPAAKAQPKQAVAPKSSRASAQAGVEVAAGAPAASAKQPPRLKLRYRQTIAPALRDQFHYANVMQVPGLVKVVVNMGVGDSARDSKVMDSAVRDLTQITGQKPQVTKARKSIAQFKLREGMVIGCHVTLRGDRMWEFADRLLSVALPRIRDFRGLSPLQFDGRGNYTFGLTEQVVFHEIDQDKIDRFRGMDITFVTTAATDDEGRALLTHLGFPFQTREVAEANKAANKKKRGPRPIGKKKR